MPEPPRASLEGRPDDGRAREELEPRDAPEPVDPLDPAARWSAQLAPPAIATAAAAPPATATPGVTRAQVSMEELVPQLVRRIAWAGDRRRGSVHLELGAGRHAGTTVTVHADDGRVRVELDGPGAAELRARIRARLEGHGLVVDSVT